MKCLNYLLIYLKLINIKTNFDNLPVSLKILHIDNMYYHKYTINDFINLPKFRKNYIT